MRKRLRLLRTTITLALLMFGVVVGCSRKTGSGAQTQRLLVAISDPPSVRLYRASAETGTLPLTTIREQPPDQPVAIGFDAAGEIFVANRNGNVRVFASNRGQDFEPVRFFAGPHTRIAQPSAIAVNMAGSFYVADLGNGHGRVEWFSGGATQDIYPDKVLEGTNTEITTPSGVAVDGAGRVFISNRDSNTVLVFDPNAQDDARPLVVLTGLHAPGHLVVDDILNIYVANQADNSVAIFESVGPRSWRLKRTLTSPSIIDLSGVAVDASNQIAVGRTGGISFFDGDSTAAAQSIRALSWATTAPPADVVIQ